MDHLPHVRLAWKELCGRINILYIIFRQKEKKVAIVFVMQREFHCLI